MAQKFTFDFRNNKKLLPIILLIFLVTVTGSISYGRFFDSYEDILLDLRFQWRPLQVCSPEIAIIEISDDSLKQLGYWPLPRDFHASLVDVLSRLGVRQVMFDIIFTDPTASDGIFYNSIKEAGNVYLPLVLKMEEGLRVSGIPQTKNIVAPILPRLKTVAKGTGYINSYKDTDGKTRWVSLLIDFNADKVPHIALRMVCDYLNVPLDQVVLKEGILNLGEKIKVPVSPGGAMLINYAGPWKKTFKHYSYVDILAAWKEKQEGKKSRIDLDGLRGKICFVGLTATGTGDLQPTPLENNYPMVGLHANVVNSILENRYVQRVDKAVNFIILLVLLAGVVWVTRRQKSKPLIAFGSTVGLSVIFLTAGFLLFIFEGLWIDLFYPFVAMLLTNVGLSIFNFLEENRKRELIERELSIAKTIQENFLPTVVPEFRNLEIAAHMITAKHVGGDLYDTCELGRSKFGIFIGDVSGKGVPAALVMAKTISLFRMLAAGADEPSDLLFQLNEEMVRSSTAGLFVTAAYLIYDAVERKVQIASAGHSETLILRSAGQKIEKILPKEGMPLGLMSRVEFSQEEAILNKADKIILYTDGIVEAKNLAREEFSQERLIKFLETTGNQPTAKIIEAIEAQVLAFAGKAPQHDDCTLIVLSERE